MKIPNLFKSLATDLFIAALIGLGGLGAFLPNLIDGLGSLLDFQRYKALRMFSAFYFIIPVFLVTNLWLIFGNRFLTKVYNLNGYNSSAAFKKAIIIIAQLIPLLVFMYDQSVWMRSVFDNQLILPCLLLIYGMAIFWYKYRFSTHRNYSIYSSHINLVHSTVLSLDLIASYILLLIMIPWLVYSSNFYIITVLYFLGCGIMILFRAESHHYRYEKSFKIETETDKTNLQRWIRGIQLLGYFCIIFAGMGSYVMLMNRPPNFQNINMLFLGTALLILIYVFYHSYKTYNKAEGLERNNYMAFLVYGILLVTVIYFTNRAYPEFQQTISKRHFFRKLETAEVLPCFLMHPGNPHSPNIDSVLKVHKTNQKLIDWYVQDCESNLMEPPETSLLNLYYGEFLNKKDSILSTQLIQNTLDTQFVATKKVLLYNRELQKILISAKDYKDTLNAYYHPINYYGHYLSEIKGKLDQAKNIQSTITELYRLIVLKMGPDGFVWDRYQDSLSSSPKVTKNISELTKKHIGEYSRWDQSKPDSVFVGIDALYKNQKFFDNRMVNKALKKVRNYYGKIRELSYLTEFLESEKLNIATLPSLLSFHRNYVYYKSHQYTERFKKAQKLFISYLVEIQYSGIYLYGMILLVLLFLFSALAKMSGYITGDEARKANNSLISASIIVFFVFLLMVIPLVKSLKPEMIDPENPQWLLSWKTVYAPAAGGVVLPDVVESPEYNITGIDNREELARVLSELESINEKLKGISEEAGNIEETITPMVKYFNP